MRQVTREHRGARKGGRKGKRGRRPGDLNNESGQGVAGLAFWHHYLQVLLKRHDHLKTLLLSLKPLLLSSSHMAKEGAKRAEAGYGAGPILAGLPYCLLAPTP